LIEEESTEPETRTEVITVVESETRTTFHVVEDQIEEHPVVEDEQIQETELFEEVVEEVIEVVEPEPVQETKPEEPYAPTKNQSTSRWAEVLFGSKDEDED
jgi:hypothetical protein